MPLTVNQPAKANYMYWPVRVYQKKFWGVNFWEFHRYSHPQNFAILILNPWFSHCMQMMQHESSHTVGRVCDLWPKTKVWHCVSPKLTYCIECQHDLCSVWFVLLNWMHRWISLRLWLSIMYLHTLSWWGRLTPDMKLELEQTMRAWHHDVMFNHNAILGSEIKRVKTI